jgi:hypothetical protein
MKTKLYDISEKSNDLLIFFEWLFWMMLSIVFIFPLFIDFSMEKLINKHAIYGNEELLYEAIEDIMSSIQSSKMNKLSLAELEECIEALKKNKTPFMIKITEYTYHKNIEIIRKHNESIYLQRRLYSDFQICY